MTKAMGYMDLRKYLTFIEMEKIAKETTNKEILEDLSNVESPEVRAAVARSIYISEETMLKLAQDINKSVRYAIACNIAITREVCIKMLEAGETKVLCRLAKNPSVPQDIKEYMVGNANEEVLIAFAICLDTSEEIFRMLSRCNSKAVLSTVYYNSSAPKYVVDAIREKL